ncbi:hypothetical protein RvY_18047 [Ramazzottius varieornatus]|uniref:G-protein coupled receptors family 1 profile domain-containing protein n=1 Tax=Ramazzottius varieornatus TaxID=947166 RepID=A0A1D1W4C5_RAMVA|nr:hypothetical protein RvY_18047 [Ramazzottius varieornatus]
MAAVPNITGNVTAEVNVTVAGPRLGGETFVFAARHIIIIIGSVGNLCLLMAAWKERISRTGTRILLINMATAAFLRQAFVQSGVLVFTYKHIANSCPFYAFGNVVVAVANWAELALSINRVFAVSYPHLYKRISAIGVSLWVCAVTWMVGIIITVLLGLGGGSQYKEMHSGTCVPVIKNGFGNFLTVAMTLLPISLSGLAIVRILSTFVKKRRARHRAVSVNPQQRRVSLRTLALARTMVVSFSWCFVSVVPWLVILNLFPKFPVTHPLATEALRLLAAAEYTVNPDRQPASSTSASLVGYVPSTTVGIFACGLCCAE